MELVADWELAHPDSISVPAWRGSSDPLGWSQGTFYSGLTALADRSANPEYANRIFVHGKSEAWGLGSPPFDADNYEFAQNWIWAYRRNHDPSTIAAVRQRFDTIIAANLSGSLLMRADVDCSVRWCWSDALFMGPPGWVAFAQVTHDPKYLAYADKEYGAAAALLFDKTNALFYHDSTFIGKTGANGEKIFWSRGNGWAYAGLARILASLPPQSASRGPYMTLYLAMSRRIVALQKADGSWASSLLDPGRRSQPETSGTAMFTYGLAWGVKTRLLKDPAYRRAADRGWNMLVRSIQLNGKLGWVQEPGGAPDEVAANDTQAYGAGAFLLAGAEMYDLAGRR